MDSRFSHLRQRDTSVSMLRVKMSRRRSQSQKENRERAVNTRRQLDTLSESCLDSTIQERTVNVKKDAKNLAVEERLKQLERWKQRKTLEKEKEKREKERKGVFKTGMYHPKDTLTIVPLPMVPSASTRARETKVNTASSQSTRVTRSMRQQVPKPLKLTDPNTAAKKAQPVVEKSTRSRAAPVKPAAPAAARTKVCAEPTVRAPSVRSTRRPPVAAAPVAKDKPKDEPADVRPTRSRAFVNPMPPPPDRRRNCKATANKTVQPAEPQVPEVLEVVETPCPPSPAPVSQEEDREDMVVDQAPADSGLVEEPVESAASLTSFAPKGFVFQAPTGLSSFKFDPLTPRSADAFLKPSFILPAPRLFNAEPEAEQSKPSPPKSPRRSPLHKSPTVAPPTPGSLVDSKHDVPYFRSEISSEAEKLTTLCVDWEPKVENESIPEEMRDRMRTAVGQARLLMKERFNQFSGLVDDCELGRGEKVTTCTDLQGFWDMVYYQVEDVHKKFNALKELESQDWVEELKPLPRQRKVVKKPSAAPAKPTGNKATAAKSRLAAIKAAMKAKLQAAEAEEAAKDGGREEDNLNSNEQPQVADAGPAESVVVDGGLLQVESPAKPSGAMRRSSRVSAAAVPQASPCSANYLSPRRITRRSLALTQTPVHADAAASPAQLIHTPHAHFRLALDPTPARSPKSQLRTPRSAKGKKDTVNVSLCFTPVRATLPADTQDEDNLPRTAETVSTQENAVSEFSVPTLVRSPVPSISVVAEQDEPAQDVQVAVLPSPRLSLSPCKTPVAPEPSSSLSFTLSPCVTPSHPTSSCPTPAQARESISLTPDSSLVEELPGLDFEMYLQPSLRCSVSPGETGPMEMQSPMEEDVEMESPRGHSEGLLTRHEPAIPAVSSVLPPLSPQVQTVESAMLLFTPDLKDRIRESVCPSDLMVFTPPL